MPSFYCVLLLDRLIYLFILLLGKKCNYNALFNKHLNVYFLLYLYLELFVKYILQYVPTGTIKVNARYIL